jgi:protein-S-isoprenylcysteine O-methyltransferase Ste14
MTPTASFDLQRVQRIRKVVPWASALLGVTRWPCLTPVGRAANFHEGVEAFGLAVIAVCIVGRAWCSLYIGGRKKAEIVDRGPYSVSRNPLYVFSFIGAFGMGAQTGSITLALLFLVLTVAVFYATVRREEAWLLGGVRPGLCRLCRPHAALRPRFLEMAGRGHAGGQAAVLPDHPARRSGLPSGRADVREHRQAAGHRLADAAGASALNGRGRAGVAALLVTLVALAACDDFKAAPASGGEAPPVTGKPAEAAFRHEIRPP